MGPAATASAVGVWSSLPHTQEAREIAFQTLPGRQRPQQALPWRGHTSATSLNRSSPSCLPSPHRKRLGRHHAPAVKGALSVHQPPQGLRLDAAVQACVGKGGAGQSLKSQKSRTCEGSAQTMPSEFRALQQATAGLEDRKIAKVDRGALQHASWAASKLRNWPASPACDHCGSATMLVPPLPPRPPRLLLLSPQGRT